MPWADLDKPPKSEQEVRVYRDDCVISLWLPAELGVFAEAMGALGGAGFDWHPGNEALKAPEGGGRGDDDRLEFVARWHAGLRGYTEPSDEDYENARGLLHQLPPP